MGRVAQERKAPTHAQNPKSRRLVTAESDLPGTFPDRDSIARSQCQEAPASHSESQPVPASPSAVQWPPGAGRSREGDTVRDRDAHHQASLQLEGRRSEDATPGHQSLQPTQPNWKLAVQHCKRAAPKLQLHSPSTHTSIPHDTTCLADRIAAKNEMKHNTPPPGHSCAEIRDCTLEAHPRSWRSWVLDARSKKQNPGASCALDGSPSSN